MSGGFGIQILPHFRFSAAIIAVAQGAVVCEMLASLFQVFGSVQPLPWIFFRSSAARNGHVPHGAGNQHLDPGGLTVWC